MTHFLRCLQQKKSFPLSPPVPKSASRAEVYVKVSVKEISFGYQVIR